MPSISTADRQRESINAFNETADPERQAKDLSRDERRMLEWLPEKGRVLEIACGEGRFTKYLLEAGYDVWALDAAPDRDRIANETGAKVVFADGATLPFRDGCFDAVVSVLNSFDYLHPLDKRLQGFRETHRVLSPGGTFTFSTHNRYWVPFPWNEPWSFLDWFREYVPTGKLTNAYREETHVSGEVQFHEYATTRSLLTDRLQSAGFQVEEIIGRDRDDRLASFDPWFAACAMKPSDEA